METRTIGFYHPDVGYYEAVAPAVRYPENVTQEQKAEADRDAWNLLINQQRVGTVAVTEKKPGEGFEFNGVGWTEVFPTLSEFEMKSLVDRTLDSVAQARGYDNRHSIVTYGVSTNPEWAAEAIEFIKYRDKVMEYLIVTLNKIDGGKELPTLQEFRESLPNPPWAPAE